jgi:hypothetical protein
MRGLRSKCNGVKELLDNGVECSKFGEQMFMTTSEVVSRSFVVIDDLLFKMLTKQFVKDGASEFQNFRVNFHKFHALFSTILSQLG